MVRTANEGLFPRVEPHLLLSGGTRLEEHIRVAAKLKALAKKRLPLCNAVNYLYKHGSRLCTLRTVFIDMYAIAAMKPKDDFGDDWRLHPEEFVRDVYSYHKPKV